MSAPQAASDGGGNQGHVISGERQVRSFRFTSPPFEPVMFVFAEVSKIVSANSTLTPHRIVFMPNLEFKTDIMKNMPMIPRTINSMSTNLNRSQKHET